MKFQHNWRQKCIENLEKDNWGEITYDDSSIVQRLYRLRKLPLEEFAVDDVRFMILQETGLPYLLTLAIELFQEDLFTEGNYYKGDLLASVLHIKPENWKGNRELWLQIEELIKPHLGKLKNFKPSLKIDNFYAAVYS